MLTEVLVLYCFVTISCIVSRGLIGENTWERRSHTFFALKTVWSCFKLASFYGAFHLFLLVFSVLSQRATMFQENLLNQVFFDQ